MHPPGGHLRAGGLTGKREGTRAVISARRLLPPVPSTRSLTPAVSFARVAQIYDATRALPAELHHELVDHLAARLRGGRTLDVGAGTGRLAVPLQRDRQLDLVPVDVSREMLSVGQRQGLRNIVIGDARCLPFRDGSFARTTSVHLLHLVAEWTLAVREIARVTSEEYLTVIKRERSTPDLSEEYDRLALGSGCDTSAPGLPERRLLEVLPPDRTEPVGGCLVTQPASQILDRLRDRVCRNQWSVPASLHGRIVRTLRNRHRDREVETVTTLEIASWSIGRLSSLERLIPGPTGRSTARPRRPPSR